MSLSQLTSIFLIIILSINQAVVKFTFKDRLTIWLYKSNIFRITTLPNSSISEPQLNSLIVPYQPSDSIPYNKSESANDPSITIIQTEDIYIQVDTNTLQVSFFDPQNTRNNQVLFQESTKSFIPITDPVSNLAIYKTRQEWTLKENTGIYGFGMYQSGVYNLRDTTIRCVQFNTEICIPYLVTNQFYGILWDNNYGITTLNSQNTNITTWDITPNASVNDYNMTTTFVANGDQSGYYTFFIDFNSPYDFGAYYENDTAATVYFWKFFVKLPNSNEFILHEFFGPAMLEMPSSMAVKGIYLKKNDKIDIIVNLQNITKVPDIYYRAPSNKMDIQSLEAQFIDYYYIYSPSSAANRFDKLMSSYRILTGGKVGLFSLNVYGFWQCQNRYHNQSELLTNAAEYRSRNIPIDNIVQDFKYWGSFDHWVLLYSAFSIRTETYFTNLNK